MKIAVCMKQVPAKDAPLRINEAASWVREGEISYETNEPDNYALEEGLRLVEKHGGEVVVVSLGPERVRQVIKEGLAKGAARAIHIADDEFYRLDPLQGAAALGGAIRDEQFDLILTGLQSDDQGFGQTGVILAELLGLPHATIIMEIELQEGRLKVKQELEAGWFQRLEMPLPALLTIQSGINKPRYATLKGIMAAKKKEIRVLARRDVLPADWRAVLETKRIYIPEKTKKTEFIAGAPKEMAAQLIEKLKHEARVL
jgi:electron transfer flavoprotein beta subunit